MSYFSPNFFIGHIHVGSIQEASCFNVGNNLPMGFQNYKKQNQGFGSITGDHNDIQDMSSMLKDGNIIDMLNQADDTEIPDWVKGLIGESIVEEE